MGDLYPDDRAELNRIIRDVAREQGTALVDADRDRLEARPFLEWRCLFFDDRRPCAQRRQKLLQRRARGHPGCDKKNQDQFFQPSDHAIDFAFGEPKIADSLRNTDRTLFRYFRPTRRMIGQVTHRRPSPQRDSIRALNGARGSLPVSALCRCVADQVFM